MRLASFASACIAVLVGCQEPESRIGHAMVQWMDWPSEVPAGQPFNVRMIVTQPCAATGFKEGSSADQSAVTFSPYFRDVREDVLCAGLEYQLSIAPGALDTLGRSPGLPADFTRTYEMRAATSVAAPLPAGSADLPVRTFGQVTAIGGLYIFDPARRNAAGFASVEADSLDCVRIRPQWSFHPEDAVPLDEQQAPATAAGFMRGRFYEAEEPVCGETRVFHLVSVN